VKVLAILQARTSSTRLPGKVLAPILGRPMLARHIERLRRCRQIDSLMVATSVDPSDDAIESLCREVTLPCHRGSLNDVLDRYHAAAHRIDPAPDHIVRVTGDCPLADPDVIDAVIRFHVDGGYDYTSNALEPSFPDGLDVEVIRSECLDEAWREAALPSEREHVMLFVYSHPERFRIGKVRSPVDLAHLRWTVDEPADLEVVNAIYAGLYPAKPDFTTADILAFLDTRPELKTLNTRHPRNEGLNRSLAAERTEARKEN
jgi:spore coat polysaccharide biosynthesis protein SpsF